jgi:hypothetical protein
LAFTDSNSEDFIPSLPDSSPLSSLGFTSFFLATGVLWLINDSLSVVLSSLLAFLGWGFMILHKILGFLCLKKKKNHFSGRHNFLSIFRLKSLKITKFSYNNFQFRLSRQRLIPLPKEFIFFQLLRDDALKFIDETSDISPSDYSFNFLLIFLEY